MRKLFGFVALLGMLTFGATSTYAQNDAAKKDTATVTQKVDTAKVGASAAAATPADQETTVRQQIKMKFIEGGVPWMTPILLCLIIGLALAIERIIYLNLATTNTKKLLSRIEDALQSGGIEAAKEICRNTKGPVASIFFQGLDRMHEGLDVVEKSVVSYGSVQMGRMESGLTWISLFITLSPMLGFLGTVVGMIGAFDNIQAAGDISPALVAGGIKVALITTVGGLIVAMILQLFYNYIISKIDTLVNEMEDASISLIDILAKHNLKK
ncbi:MAG TPA: MotA/TolQ/ExbB proton channel family protein [Williamwhitmania sp.]|nr:MotA/TolQ/ExbB proton channel family protein [Williamwhitmania sp.]